MLVSKLKKHPLSKIVESGYINVYSKLNPKELRQLYYNRKYKEKNPPWDNTMIRLCQRFSHYLNIHKKLNKEIFVLDTGCGNGNYIIDTFRQELDWACGVDISPTATKKNICLDEIKFSDLEHIPYKDNTFNFVLSLWVIEHLVKPDRVFAEIFRVLKPGGYLLLATPNRNSWLITLKELIQSNKLNALINKSLYGRFEEDIFPTNYLANTILKLSQILKETGFTDIDLKLNYDPGYTSINNITFNFSCYIHRLLNLINENIDNQHIIGIAKKR